jgi:LemA protein
MSWLLFLLFALLLLGIALYNRLVSLKNQTLAAWSDIDVQLKRRHDLIPKLIDAVKQYAAYEQSTLDAVTELRSRSAQLRDPHELEGLETELGQQLNRLIAVAEAYPELKANQSFLSLQKDISEVENDLQYARRYYNGSVRMLNTRIDSFPDLIIAGLFGFRHAVYFQLEQE